MPLPIDFDTITVTGRYIDLAGNALAGTVTFTSSTTVVDPSVPVTIVPVPIVATLDANGAFSIDLPATDDPDVSPTGYTYKVEERFGGKLLRSYNILVPVDTVGNLDLSTVAPVASVTASVQLLPLSGGTMTGPLTLSGNPTTNLGAATKQYVDARDIVTSGGTISGEVTLNGTGATGTPPLGLDDAVHTGLNILSSFAGGEDEGQPGQFDSTGRLNLYSFQRADVGSYGENIRRFLMRFNAKSMDAWYAARQNGAMTHGYDGSGNADADADWVPVAWTGAHIGANDGLSMHGHWSVEVPDVTGAVQTRFEVPFTDQELAEGSRLLGVDVTNIRTNLADLSIRANLGVHGTGYLRIGGGNSVPKELLLSISSDRATSGRRWGVRANTTTESGSNLGTDLELVRYSDAGAELGPGMVIRRSNGQVAFGGSTVTGGSVRVNWSTSGQHGFYAVPSASAGTAAAFATLMTATTDRAVDIRVSGDGNARLVVLATGQIEWGDGSTRDTNLYRSAANVLKTDDKLITAVGLGVGNSAAATTAVGTLVRKMEVFDASGASLGFVPIYSSIT